MVVPTGQHFQSVYCYEPRRIPQFLKDTIIKLHGPSFEFPVFIKNDSSRSNFLNSLLSEEAYACLNSQVTDSQIYELLGYHKKRLTKNKQHDYLNKMKQMMKTNNTTSHSFEDDISSLSDFCRYVIRRRDDYSYITSDDRLLLFRTEGLAMQYLHQLENESLCTVVKVVDKNAAFAKLNAITI